MLEFCLQRAGVLFVACWSFVCSVREFRLQRAGVLFAACNSFVCSVPGFAVFSLCESGVHCGPP